jgi:ribonuclease T1
MKRLARIWLACLLIGWTLGVAPSAALDFTGAMAKSAQSPSVALAQLPPEAQTTLKLIKQGGPFPYPKDGATFGNRERRLPAAARAYYKEYTVKTSGARNRGTRRIIAGAGGELYYTDDHYNTFRRIAE